MHEGKYFEVQVDSSLQKLGFTKLSIFGKNIVVGVQGRNPVVSTYRKDEWERTAKSLEKKLLAEGIKCRSASQLIVFMTQEFLKYTETEQLKQESVQTRIQKGL